MVKKSYNHKYSIISAATKSKEKKMAHFGNKSKSCKDCIPFQGFKFMGIIVAGSVIGFAASRFVEPPPSVKLLLNTQHNNDTINIIEKLNKMELDVISIKKDILRIRQQLEQKTKKEE